MKLMLRFYTAERVPHDEQFVCVVLSQGLLGPPGPEGAEGKPGTQVPILYRIIIPLPVNALYTVRFISIWPMTQFL